MCDAWCRLTPLPSAPAGPLRSVPPAGAYLLGLMPPELLRTLRLELPLLRRDPHYFLASRGGRHLLLGSNAAAARAQFAAAGFSEADWRAREAMGAELAALAADLAPAWLAEPLGLEATAERHVRPVLRGTFEDLCRGSVLEYLERFGFQSNVLKVCLTYTNATEVCVVVV